MTWKVGLGESSN